MADVTHSEHKHEPTSFERFEQLAKKVLGVKREEVGELPKEGGKPRERNTRGNEEAE